MDHNSAGLRVDISSCFQLIYRGGSEINRHYTKPMLPWIISEIRNQKKSISVDVKIYRGIISVYEVDNILFSHTVQQIHKCVMEQDDHTCFLYTLKTGAADKEDESDLQLVPANINTEENYQCHLFQASSEERVHEFFACLRHQPREAYDSDSKHCSISSLPDLSVHNDSQFFEVLYLGRVKVSHSRVPSTFIDEAVEAFKQKDKKKKRYASGGYPSTGSVALFQQNGSGVSAPSIILNSSSMQDIDKDAKSEDLFKLVSRPPKVRFTLWSSTESGSTSSLPSPVSKSSDSHDIFSILKDKDKNTRVGNLAKESVKFPSDGDISFKSTSLPSESSRRIRTSSGDYSLLINKLTESCKGEPMRERSGSIGSKPSALQRARASEADMKSFFSDFNRTMLFHIGHQEIQLINPEIKLVQLHKPFKDIAHCCQGTVHSEHFGFICREISKDNSFYVGYVFRCEQSSVTDEVLQSLSKAFSAMHEAKMKEKLENELCENCPLLWFSLLCADVEGLPAARTHSIIMKKVDGLPEDERDSIITKYEGVETSDSQMQNDILMMLLRAHFEYKQGLYSYRTEFHLASNFEASFKKAKKSLATSFSHLLRRDGRDEESCEKEANEVGSPVRTTEEDYQDTENISCHKPYGSFRHAILQRVFTPTRGPPASDVCPNSVKRDQTTSVKRSASALLHLWRKAIFRQMLLNRIDRAYRIHREMQQEAARQRVMLSYEEEEIPPEAYQAWEMLLSKPSAKIDVSILCSGICQGIPKSIRGEVWQLLLTQSQMWQRRNQDLPFKYHLLYEDILRELTSQQHAILIDLGRTFPTHPYFNQTLGPGQLSLFNILKAYSLLDEEVGYCQGLSFVAGILLLHTDEDKAYQLLKHLMFVLDCRRQYRPDLHGLQIQMYQLSRLLRDKIRCVYDHLEAHEVTPQLYAAPWFLTLFASQFPLSFVVRVFDVLLLEGLETIFRIALVLLKKHEEQLLSCQSFEQITNYMKTILPNISPSGHEEIFMEVFDISLAQELSAYEVEYHVLQEELSLSPQHDVDICKLKEANRNLKRQNLSLLEQLHNVKSQKYDLEEMNQALQQNQHHLEVRIRFLELERTNLRQLVSIFCRASSSEVLANVPLSLERYLPNKASSPMPEDRRVHFDLKNENGRSQALEMSNQ